MRFRGGGLGHLDPKTVEIIEDDGNHTGEMENDEEDEEGGIGSPTTGVMSEPVDPGDLDAAFDRSGGEDGPESSTEDDEELFEDDSGMESSEASDLGSEESEAEEIDEQSDGYEWEDSTRRALYLALLTTT